MGERDGAGLDAVVINASGCGTTVKDYGFMLREDPDWAERAAAVSGMTKDITEPGLYSAVFSAEKDKDWKRKVARFRRGENLIKRIKKLEDVNKKP